MAAPNTEGYHAMSRKSFKNNPALAGKPFGRVAALWGPDDNPTRYCIRPIHTRFDAVQFFVTDAEKTDDVTDLAAVIRQSESVVYALRGLNAPPRVFAVFGLDESAIEDAE